jgi:hypothetical protein
MGLVAISYGPSGHFLWSFRTPLWSFRPTPLGPPPSCSQGLEGA